MSHHLDTPPAGENRQLYIDDLYLYEGRPCFDEKDDLDACGRICAA
jgi:hypothetical protein